MNKFLAIILFLNYTLLIAQSGIVRLTEMQKIFFVSEASGLASTSYNPAAIGLRTDNTGVLFGYDFNNFSSQGNASVFLTFKNFGASYQDVYDINDVRLQNYSINFSVGNDWISVGNSNRYTIASYPSYRLKLFSFDGGVIFKPFDFLNFGFLARNINEIRIDSLDYPRNYTAGIGLILFDEKFSIYVDADFNDNTGIKNAITKLGFVIIPAENFEFRLGTVVNPDDLIVIKGKNTQLIDLNYQAFISVSFLIENTLRLTAAAQFNDRGEKTKFSTVLGFPL